MERDVWQQVAYDLTLKVAEEANLQTIKRLQLSEKSWSKLAGHFAIVLSDKDTQQVSIAEAQALSDANEKAVEKDQQVKLYANSFLLHSLQDSDTHFVHSN